jgi:signal peptidase I
LAGKNPLTTTALEPAPPKPEKKKETLSESIAGFASVFVSGLFIITFIFQNFEIPSPSMEQTLLIGDHVFVDRLTPSSKARYVGPLLPYREVHRGDIIVFLSPVEPGLHVVKRIIGVPGDRIHLVDGVVYRNGERLQEPYLAPHNAFDYSPYRDNFPAVAPEFGNQVDPTWAAALRKNIQAGDLVVPPDKYFGMGDNRDRSLDSRFWGFIPRENVIGRPLFIYWSFVTPEDQYLRTSLTERVGFVLHVVSHFVSETRWSRMFHLVH